MLGKAARVLGGSDPIAPFPALELGLSVLYTLLYAGLFLFTYLQLWLLFYYREKRLSYRTVCLFLCLLWAALRTVLFSYYLQTSLQAVELRLQPFPHWLLFCFPVCLLFATICLLNLYFAEVIFKVKCAAEFNKYKAVLYMGSIFISLLFIFVNLTCTLLVHDDVPDDQLRWTVFIRALINDSLFILSAILLACCMCKLSKVSSANVYLESKGTSLCQALLVGSVVILLHSSRAFYNLVAVAIAPDYVPSPFNYGWDNLSDKVNGKEVNSEEYVVFGVVLFLWEFVPTIFVVLFFRAQKLAQNLAPAGMVNSHSYSSRAYFFDNPRRYDSDDDLPRLAGGSASARTGVPGDLLEGITQLDAVAENVFALIVTPSKSLATPQSSGWYGSLTGSDSCIMIPPLVAPPMDVAPLLFSHESLESISHHSSNLKPPN